MTTTQDTRPPDTTTGEATAPRRPRRAAADATGPDGPPDTRRWIGATAVIAALFVALVVIAAATGLRGAGWDANPVETDGFSGLSDPSVYPLSATAGLPTLPERVPTVTKVTTDEPVVFITIDDGWTMEPRVLELLRQRGAPVTVFPIGTLLEPNADQWAAYQQLGGTVENHTWTHPYLARLDPDAQREELCRQADAVQRITGRRPTMVRPPFGSSNIATTAAAPRCGGYVIVKWSMEVRDRRFLFDRGPQQPEPGDIILLHFRPETYDELVMLFEELDRVGLRAAPLQDFIGPDAAKTKRSQ
jgi:peptidoglycan/xylan/chitin deacetylase (PgdA/CDA1 family)